MKKFLCAVIALSMLLAALPAFAADCGDLALLPAHVRWVKSKMDGGEYGNDVHQFFFYDPVSGRYCDILLYYEDGLPRLHRIWTDCEGEPDDSFSYRMYGYGRPSEGLCGFINGGGFADLKDCEGDGDIDVYYAHLTADGVDYMQINGLDGNSPYYPIISLVMEDSRFADDVKYYREQYAIYAAPLQERYERGELGDEAFVLKSYSTWNGNERVIGIISVKDGRAVIVGENGCRELPDDGLARIKGFVEENNFDALPHYTNSGVNDGGGYRYVHLTPEGTKYLKIHNALIRKTKIMGSGGEWVEAYDAYADDGAVYADLEQLVYSLYEDGGLKPCDGSEAKLWDEAEPPINKVSISVNGSAAGEGVDTGQAVTAPLDRALLDALGIKRTKRPDMSTVVLSRGTRLVMYEPCQSTLTVVDAGGYDSPDALAAALSSPAAYESGAAKAVSIGYTVANERLPLEAVCRAFGLEYAADGGSVSINAPAAESLDSDYVKRLTALLMSGE